MTARRGPDDGSRAPGPSAVAEGAVQPSRGSPWRMVVSTVVTVAVLVVVFFGIFPKVADYSEAWSSIQQMPPAYLVALVVATMANLAAYVWPLQAALPGLGYGPGFVVRQTSFAISNAVPAGGAVGLGVQYGMLDSYGFGAGAAASAIAIVSVFNVFATLVMPVLGVLALLASGMAEGTYVLLAAIGVLATGIAVVAFTMVLGSERGARTVGHWADRLADPLTRRLRHGRSVDLTGTLLDFRSSVVGVMQARWVQVTLSTLLLQLTSWAILVLAICRSRFQSMMGCTPSASSTRQPHPAPGRRGDPPRQLIDDGAYQRIASHQVGQPTGIACDHRGPAAATSACAV